MNYGELQTAFEGLLKRRDLTTTQRDTWLQNSISRAQRLLRVPAMERSVEVTITEGDDGEIVIPDDLLDLKAMTVDAEEQDLTQKSLREVLASRVSTGIPTMYVRRAGSYVLGQMPTAGTVVRLDYWAELDALEAAEDENWLSIIANDVILDGALVRACRYFMDKRHDSFEMDFLRGIQELKDQGALDETANAAVAPAHIYESDE